MLEELLPEPPRAAAPDPKGHSSVRLRDLASAFEAEAHPASPDSVRRILHLAARAFGVDRAVLTSGFGMEGCALIDMLSRGGPRLPIVFLDTGFHFEETLVLRARLIERYPFLRFETLEPEHSPEQQSLSEGPELWLRDPDRCCGLRKVQPLERRLATADLWISAVTRSQSPERAQLPVLSPSSRFRVPKLAPLAAWSRAEIWRYVESHDVPHNPLHLRHYPSVGCRHCTLPVPGTGPADYSREGRWRAQAKTECGLHLEAPLENTFSPSPSGVHDAP